MADMQLGAAWLALRGAGLLPIVLLLAACGTSPQSKEAERMASGASASGMGGPSASGASGNPDLPAAGASSGANAAPLAGEGAAPSMDGGPSPLPDGDIQDAPAEAGTSGGTMSAAGASGDTGDSGAAGAAGGAGDPSCPGGREVDFRLVGWATQNGGTTGGKGGTTVNVSDGAALIAALAAKQDSATPLTILVSGRITEGNSGGASKIDVKDVRDVSILGTGSGAELDGIGIKIVRASNIVIRNLRIHHVAIGDKDAISIEGPADHVWIDHCELYADYQGVDKDFYDGLLDAKGEAEYITYSWNYMHDSWKTSLVGSSEDDTFDRKITMHHNYYRNCNSRLPLFRGGQGHVFNNYYLDIAETGINSRIGACLRIEGNYFSNAKNPWVSAYSDSLGGAELSCNVLADGSAFAYASDVHELPSCVASVPYDYADVLNHPDHVPEVVMANAGVGKLTDPTQF